MDRTVLFESFVLMALASVGLFEGTRLTGIDLVIAEPLGPGWYLVAVSALLFFTGSLYLVEHARTAKPAMGGTSFSLHLGPASRALLLLVAYVGSMPIVGYLISTGLFFVLALRIFGVRSWVISAVIGVALAALFRYGFGELAGMALP